MELFLPTSKLVFNFYKYQASGNDFVLIEDRDETFPLDDIAFIQKICDRKRGIGADGLLLLQSSDQADGRMRIFNSDGQEANLCGNGLRIIGSFLLKNESSGSIIIDTKVGLHKVEKIEGIICVSFPLPKLIRTLSLSLFDQDLTASLVDAGVRHLLIQDLGLNEYPSIDFLQGYRKEFDANVSLYFGEKDTLRIRTFERGVEGETSSCGTASISLASILPLERAQILYPQDELFTYKDEKYVRLSGSVSSVFSGTYTP